MNRELEAKNFEAWARKRGMNPQQKPGGGYYSRETQVAAMAWSQRAKIGEAGFWMTTQNRPPEYQQILFFDGERVQAGFYGQCRYENLEGRKFPEAEVTYWRPFPDNPYGPTRADD